MNNYDIEHLSLKKLYELVEHHAGLDDRLCDGDCDEEFPYIKCDICESRHFINEFAEDIRNHFRNMNNNDLKKYRHPSLIKS